jgi:chemotaxis protein methyltransferase CheR
MKEREFEFIRRLVYERSRISLGPDKRELVAARLGKRLRATRLDSVTDYCELLQSPQAGEELGNLIDAISTNHTFFFREPAHFEFLRASVVPEMTARARLEGWNCFRLWSAASSSGEEAFSIAMTLSECGLRWPWYVEGTDISHRIVARATAAIYAEEAVSRIPLETSRRYFLRGTGPQEGNYRIKPELRQGVNFRQMNLLEGEPPYTEPFQVIFCRNVMIYFDRPTQEELVGRLTRHLVPGGYLFVGHAESLSPIRHSLRPVRPAVYQKPLGN